MHQLVLECLIWGEEVEAFSGRVIVGVCTALDVFAAEGVEVGFSGQEASQSADGIFDAAFLPWAVGIAEVGADIEAVVELVMLGELGAPFVCPPAAGAQDRIIEGDGLAQGFGQRPEPCDELLCQGLGLLG